MRGGVRAAAPSADGALAISGDFTGGDLDLGNGVVVPASSQYDDQFVAVMEADGTPRWALHLGDAIAEPVTSLAVAGAALITGGWYSGAPLSFGDGDTPVLTDAYVASVTSGAIDWVTEVRGSGYEDVTIGAAGATPIAQVDEEPTSDTGPHAFDIGHVHVTGDSTLFATLTP
jgi:hypothetical protein